MLKKIKMLIISIALLSILLLFLNCKKTPDKTGSTKSESQNIALIFSDVSGSIYSPDGNLEANCLNSDSAIYHKVKEKTGKLLNQLKDSIKCIEIYAIHKQTINKGLIFKADFSNPEDEIYSVVYDSVMNYFSNILRDKQIRSKTCIADILAIINSTINNNRQYPCQFQVHIVSDMMEDCPQSSVKSFNSYDFSKYNLTVTIYWTSNYGKDYQILEKRWRDNFRACGVDSSKIFWNINN